jgi:FAD/FMN-containing dehydrogenase
LVAALGADRVLTRALDLIRYASDASAYRLIPQAVAVPRDVSDMAALLRCATELGLSGALAAVAALQQVTGRPYESLVLALETLTRV